MLEFVQNGLDEKVKMTIVTISSVSLIIILISMISLAKQTEVDFIQFKINLIDNQTVEVEIKNVNSESHQVDLMIKNENGFSALMKPGDEMYQKLKLPFNVTKNDFKILVDGGKFVVTGTSITDEPPMFPIRNIALVMLLSATVFVAIVLISFYKFTRKISNESNIYY